MFLSPDSPCGTGQQLTDVNDGEQTPRFYFKHKISANERLMLQAFEECGSCTSE